MKTILVPTDFSEVAVNAAAYAVQLARKSGAKLYFFHANEHREKTAQKKLRAQLDALGAEGLSYDFIITDRFFNSLTINETINVREIDLVVMGTIGDDGGFRKNIFGTNTGELLDDLQCPLLAVPENCSYGKLNKIAYASDLFNLKKELVVLAKFAAQFEAEIIVFHVSPVYPDLGDVEKRNIRKELEGISREIGYSNISYYKEKMDWDNQVHKGISQFVESRKPDLLVMFHENQGAFDRFFSDSHSEKAVKDFDLPMLVFPKKN